MKLSIRSFLLIVIAIIGIFPMVFIIPNIRAIGLVLILIWIATDVLKKMMLRNFHISPYEIAIYLLFSYMVIISYVTTNLPLANRYFELLGAFIFFIGYHGTTLAVRRVIIYFVLILASVAYIITVNELIYNPFSSRGIKTSDVDTINMLKNGVGGYSYIYFSTFLGLISAGAIMLPNKSIAIFNKKERMQFIVVYLASIFIAFLSNYLTSIIMLLTAPLIFLFVREISRFSALRFISTMIVGGLIYMFIDELTIIMVGVFEIILGDGWTLQRIKLIGSYFVYGDSLEDLTGARRSVWQVSINSALSSPFFGVVIDDYNIEKDYFERIGQHSFFLDSAAAFGLIVGVIVVVISIFPFVFKYNKQNSQVRLFSLYILTCVIVFLTINNLTTSIGFAVYFIFPFLCDIVNQRMDKLKILRKI